MLCSIFSFSGTAFYLVYVKSYWLHVFTLTKVPISLFFSSIISGEAIYEIGVEDNGLMTGLSDEDMSSSLDTLREMARRLEATIHVLRERVQITELGLRTVKEVLVRKVLRKMTNLISSVRGLIV